MNYRNVEAFRAQAIVSAERELTTRGFKKNSVGSWEGLLGVAGFDPVELTIEFGAGFPQKIPNVYVDSNKLPIRIPHVDQNDKLCIAPDIGLLIDVSDVPGIINDTLQYAEKTLKAGLSKSNHDDFFKEFEAYWHHETQFTLSSIFLVNGFTREAALSHCLSPDRSAKSLLSNTAREAETWCNKVNWTIIESLKCFYIHLEKPFVPPDYKEKLNVAEFLRIIRDNSSEADFSALSTFLSKESLPAVIAISMPFNGETIFSVSQFSASREHPRKSKFTTSPSDRHRALSGFRGKVPATHELKFCSNYALQKVLVSRVDPDYLCSRTGAARLLDAKKITLIGCGAIGSHAAFRLASAGFQEFNLVDNDTFSADNIYRQAMDFSCIGKKKSEALANLLFRQYPHLKIKHRDANVDALLKSEPAFILKSDLIVIAIGDATLELMLNDLLRDEVPRLHTWLEQLGIGGHVLTTGLKKGLGCYQCLHQKVSVGEQTYVWNQASLAAPGQDFTKSISGCAGVFTPFSGLDADQTAIYVARAAIELLSGKIQTPTLLTWLGNAADFESAGFVTSDRFRDLVKTSFRIEENFYRRDCPVCQNQPD